MPNEEKEMDGIYKVIIIKVEHSKNCKKRTIGQNDLKFDPNIFEAGRKGM